MMVDPSRPAQALVLLLQTPEVQNVLQAAEEPEQRGEEQGGAGRSPRQRLQGAAAAHAASGGRPVINSAEASGVLFFPSEHAATSGNAANRRGHEAAPSVPEYATAPMNDNR